MRVTRRDTQKGRYRTVLSYVCCKRLFACTVQYRCNGIQSIRALLSTVGFGGVPCTVSVTVGTVLYCMYDVSVARVERRNEHTKTQWSHFGSERGCRNGDERMKSPSIVYVLFDIVDYIYIL